MQCLVLSAARAARLGRCAKPRRILAIPKKGMRRTLQLGARSIDLNLEDASQAIVSWCHWRKPPWPSHFVRVTASPRVGSSG